MNKTVEILQYTLHKNAGDAFHTIMQEISVPLHQRHGIDVVAYGNSLHDLDCYYLIRAFESAETMNAVLDAFYACSDWRSGPREDIIRCIETSIKVVINLPSISVDGLRMQAQNLI
ncbi:NIPSNAP family protein [Escherichia coli]|uniref:NIPSNAP family protein n=1 Tax=Escherichia coli TaxID=562 RepID=A0A2L0J496_ECOLX|nr:NIPSNAP family protein [Escherichia coli]AUY01615.1 NIPSNAP family protein [Escherichia coli]EEW1511280.1 NIPSNAP family protein [Escherichia coli]EFH8495177.1 NIPSNAP family protein [Escherichia coli]EFJ8793183.1 NIPSNAP family protein [Escherichia coli]EFL9542632.1 NIPSNAP family protein [Escherichia coli]